MTTIERLRRDAGGCHEALDIQAADELESAQKCCAEMRQALGSALAGVWDGHYSGNGVEVGYAQAVDEEVKHALSSDCGKDYIHKRELGPTIEFLRDVVLSCSEDPDADEARKELARLESLKGEK